jgi:hypothetical protein
MWLATALVALTSVASVSAQNVPVPSAPTPHWRASHKPGPSGTGCLAQGELNFLKILPPYPALQSPEDEADVETLRQLQRPVDSPRWQLAQADKESFFALVIEVSRGRLAPNLLAVELAIVVSITNPPDSAAQNLLPYSSDPGFFVPLSHGDTPYWLKYPQQYHRVRFDTG